MTAPWPCQGPSLRVPVRGYLDRNLLCRWRRAPRPARVGCQAWPGQGPGPRRGCQWRTQRWPLGGTWLFLPTCRGQSWAFAFISGSYLGGQYTLRPHPPPASATRGRGRLRFPASARSRRVLHRGRRRHRPRPRRRRRHRGALLALFFGQRRAPPRRPEVCNNFCTPRRHAPPRPARGAAGRWRAGHGVWRGCALLRLLSRNEAIISRPDVRYGLGGEARALTPFAALAAARSGVLTQDESWTGRPSCSKRCLRVKVIFPGRRWGRIGPPAGAQKSVSNTALEIFSSPRHAADLCRRRYAIRSVNIARVEKCPAGDAGNAGDSEKVISLNQRAVDARPARCGTVRHGATRCGTILRADSAACKVHTHGPGGTATKYTACSCQAAAKASACPDIISIYRSSGSRRTTTTPRQML